MNSLCQIKHQKHEHIMSNKASKIFYSNLKALGIQTNKVIRLLILQLKVTLPVIV